MIVGRWYVQPAAIWHWYLPLCIYITFLKVYIVSVHSFLSFFFFFNMISINLTAWSTIPACSILMCSFNRGNIEGTNSSNTFV